MAHHTVCPLCGTKYGPDETLCPADGRLLVDEAGSDPDVTETSDPVRLSSATEALLGSILDSSPSKPGRARKRHGEVGEERTQIGPPPDMSEHLPRPGEEEVVETTVATAVPQAPPDSALPSPLASLDLSSDDHAVSAPIPKPPRKASKKPIVSVEQLRGLEDSDETIRAPARVFDNLHMEAAQLAADVGDDEPTRRVRRDEQNRLSGPVRSELPPEFEAALRAEAKQASRAKAKQKSDLEATEAVEAAKVVDAVEDDEPLEPIGFKLDEESEDDATKRDMPRPQDLPVQRMEMRIGGDDDRGMRYAFVGIILFAAAVAAFLGYLIGW